MKVGSYHPALALGTWNVTCQAEKESELVHDSAVQTRYSQTHLDTLLGLWSLCP